jgi:hypothetical protein
MNTADVPPPTVQHDSQLPSPADARDGGPVTGDHAAHQWPMDDPERDALIAALHTSSPTADAETLKAQLTGTPVPPPEAA